MKLSSFFYRKCQHGSCDARATHKFINDLIIPTFCEEHYNYYTTQYRKTMDWIEDIDNEKQQPFSPEKYK